MAIPQLWPRFVIRPHGEEALALRDAAGMPVMSSARAVSNHEGGPARHLILETYRTVGKCRLCDAMRGYRPNGKQACELIGCEAEAISKFLAEVRRCKFPRASNFLSVSSSRGFWWLRCFRRRCKAISPSQRRRSGCACSMRRMEATRSFRSRTDCKRISCCVRISPRASRSAPSSRSRYSVSTADE